MADAPMMADRHRDIVRNVLSGFADRIDRVAVFGSRALGRAGPASDIDLVLYGSLDDAAIARIWSMLDRSTLPVPVDVVRYEGLGQGPFRSHIDRYAKPLFERRDLVATRPAVPADRLSPDAALG